MPLYIILGKYTQEGITNIKDSPKRLEDAKNVIKSLGGEMKDFYYTMGQYDFVSIGEFPDDNAATKAILLISGNFLTAVCTAGQKGSYTVR